MSTTKEPILASSLADTLTLALSQCQQQVRQLEEQSKLVEDLRQENERLREELDKLRNRTNDDIEARYRTQFQNAFKQIAEKQFEIDSLKEKLRSVKVKARRRGLIEPISSSPAFRSSGMEARDPTNLSAQQPSDSRVDGQQHGSISAASNEQPLEGHQGLRKRQRSPSPPRKPLQEVPVNVIPVTGQRDDGGKEKRPSRQIVDGRGVAAIPELAEDGEHHLPRTRRTDAEEKSKGISRSVYDRLSGLLETRSASSPLLLRTRSNSPPQKNINNTPARPASSITNLSISTMEPRLKRPRSSLAGSKKAMSANFEDQEPLRSRPVNRLGLMHFKLNPAANAGLDYAYNQVVRGQERKCLSGCTRECCVGIFRALAGTLPKPIGRDGRPLSDYQMLLEYLGAGSEERVKNMTSKARENLLHDAKVKLIADAHGKMHRDVHERGKSPPGFWRTDMAGSQEEKQDREKARLAEREEVSRRYNEALRDGGRWVFADE